MHHNANGANRANRANRANGDSGRFDGWQTRIGELRQIYLKIRRVAEESARLTGGSDGDLRLQQLTRTGSALERETFRIMVLGEFSSGKSTLINAMLGKNLLPAKANPATAFTTMLRWGETEKAELYRTADRRGGPTVVGIEEFKREVTLQFDAVGEPREPAFALAVVSQQLELLTNSVEIVDSAGVNESPERELVTLSFLEQVDAVVYVTDANRPFSTHETQHYLGHVLQLGHRDVFFVVNKFDHVPDDEQAEVISRCRSTVAQVGAAYGGFSAVNVFFVSARDALRSRLDSDAELERASGIGSFERALELFCLQDAARVKLLRLAEYLRYNAVGLRGRLHNESSILDQSAERLRAMLEQSQSTQDQLQHNVAQIREHIEEWIIDVEHRIRIALTDFLVSLSEQVPGWTSQHSPWLDALGQRLTREGRETMVRKIFDGYRSILQRRMQIFCTETIEPLIADHQEKLITRLDPLLREHEAAFEVLHSELTGTAVGTVPGYLLRMLATSVGEQAGGRGVLDGVPLRLRPGSVLVAGAGAGAAAGGGLSAATAAGLIALGFSLPPLGVTLAIGAALGPLMAAASLVLSGGKLRGRAADAFAEQMRHSAATSAKEYASSRTHDLREVWRGVSLALKARLEELIGGVRRNVQGSRQDEQSKLAARSQLYAFERELTAIEAEISEFLLPYLPDIQDLADPGAGL
ncbi:dynamin family protein [Streptomyces sp. NBC_01198]|uniref:dynamin family protein n=1 Tax=Streptomyces sp. NBC_01198 TaxID=2903769 RepID=UPI002E135E78|nr:dynamin family protein [Streptomyces sp. NBC_01198]